VGDPPAAVEALESRRLLTVVIDDGDVSGYGEGVATGVPLVAGPTDDAAPDAVTDSAGNIYATFTVGGRLSYIYKPKGAANWQPAIDLGITGVSTPRMAADPAGNLFIVYSANSDIFYVKRPAGSGAWTSPTQISSLPTGSSTVPDAAADGLGRLNVVWQDDGAGTGTKDIRYRRVEANASLSTEFTAGNLGDDRSPRVAANAGGGVSLVWNVWNTSTNQASEIHHASLNGDGISFSAPTRLDATTLRSVEPDVVLANDGTVHVAFHDDNNGNWEVAYTKRAAGSGSFAAPQYILPDPGVVDGTVSLALGPDNAVHISWQGTGTVYTARNTGGAWSTPQVLMVEVGATTNSIAVDGFNRTHVLSTVQRTGLTNNNSADLWTWSEPASVVDRKIFYNNSGFDGRNASQNALDDNAIATDKLALIPGTGAATFANYTSYDKGINGVMIDVAGLASSSLTAADFGFFVGNVNDSSTWAAAPAPAAIGVRPGAGTGGSDRVTITWADGAVAKKWLRVQLKADAATGLATPDNFIFGNAVGESGDNALNAFVDSADVAGARDNPRGFVNPAPVNFRWDYNRDRFVDTIDMAIARDNPTGFANSLRLINPPAIAAPASNNGWAVNNSDGYGGDFRTANSATSGSTAYASYVFTNLPNGTYEIQATWVPSAGNATNAPMSFSVGSSTGRQEFTINQQVAPNGLSSGGRPFQTLGTITGTNNAGAYRVFVYARGNGPVAADAVRLFQQPPVQDITYDLDAADGVPAKEIDADVVTDSQGNVHQVYTDGPNTNDNFRAMYRFKAAGSNTWGAPTLIGGTGGVGGTKIARDANNNLYVVYHDQNQVWFTTRPAGGSFWSPPVRISGTYGDGTPRKALWPQIAVDAQSRIHVVWHENTAPSGQSSVYYVFYRIFENGAWQTTEQVNTTTAANSADPDVAVAPDGRAFVTWTGPGSPAPVMFRERAANGGWSTPFTMDTIRSGGTSVVSDAAGNPHVTWIRDTSGTGAGGNNWDTVYRDRINGVWGTTKVFSNPNGIDVEPHLVIKPDNSMTLFWCDSSIYLARYINGAWTATTTIASGVGAASLNAVYDPVLDVTHMVSAARKLGYTYSDSWDVLYYTE
jgi:hypothetical protein